MLCLCNIHLLSAQADPQWYVKEGINSEISISRLSYPCTGCNPYARKDIFVIYSDGSHYNSRIKPASINSPNFAPFNPGFHTFNFQSTHSSPIKYLYLTNIYQGDDPPEIIVSGPVGIPSSSYNFSITTPSKLITSNHDIVKNKDLTLIIHVEHIVKTHFPLTLKSNFLIPISAPGSSTYINPTAFDQSNVFFSGSTSYFPNYNIQINNNSFTIAAPTPNSNVPPFIYFNLRPSTNLIDYFPQLQGAPQYKISFELVNQFGVLLDSLQEELRDSHDPNFIRVEKICKNSKGEQFVYYHAQFQNISQQPQNELKLGFELPEIFDHNCITAYEWKVGNLSGDANTNVNAIGKKDPIELTHGEPPKTRSPRNKDQTQVTFVFDPKKSIQTCDNSNEDLSIGYVKFCVKVKNNNIDLRNSEIILEPLSRYTIFGTTYYPIDNFYDICTKTKGSDRCTRIYSLSECKCKCSRKNKWKPF